MIERQTLLCELDAVLQPERFKDVAPNGLQVEGRPQIHRVVSGVSASVALIEAAIAAKADALFVHHGLFWRGQDARVGGWLRQRLGLLLQHNINLYAYHLPLDAHPGLGRFWACWPTAVLVNSNSVGWGGPAARRWPMWPSLPNMLSTYWGAK